MSTTRTGTTRTSTGDDVRDELVATVRRAIARTFPVDVVIRAAEEPETRDDSALWRVLGEIGCTALGPGDLGGLGLLGPVVAECGYGLVPAGLLGHALATRALSHAATGGADAAASGGGPTDAARDWLARLGEGTCRATVGAGWDGTTVRLREDGNRWCTDGSVDRVFEPDTADVVVLPAEFGDGTPALVVIPTGAPGARRTAVSTYDPTRRFGRLDLAGVAVPAGQVLATGRSAEAVRHAVLAEGALLVAFDSVGSAKRALDDAVAYASERHQFGVPIGSFQAVKHLLVDAHVATDHARSAAMYAAEARDAGADDAAFAVHVAKALAVDAHTTVAAAAVQVHGGIGFTREVAAHLHVRRARVNEHLFGDARSHRMAVVAELPRVLPAWSGEPSPADTDGVAGARERSS